jgi:hypothetical protein
MVAPITPGALKTPDNPDGVDTAALEKAREALCKDHPHVIVAAAPAFFGAPKNPVSAEMMQWWTDMLLQRSMKVLLQLHRVFTTTDFRPDLQTISLPARTHRTQNRSPHTRQPAQSLRERGARIARHSH